MNDAQHPHWRRPVVFDVTVGERRLFWNELSIEQRFEELNYQAYKNKQLLNQLQRGEKHGNNERHDLTR